MQIALNEPSIFYITPSIVNERISRQQGGFLIPANISVSFTELLKSYYKNGPNYISFGDLVTYAEKAKFAQTDITILKINIPRN